MPGSEVAGFPWGVCRCQPWVGQGLHRTCQSVERQPPSLDQEPGSHTGATSFLDKATWELNLGLQRLAVGEGSRGRQARLAAAKDSAVPLPSAGE